MFQLSEKYQEQHKARCLNMYVVRPQPLQTTRTGLASKKGQDIFAWSPLNDGAVCEKIQKPKSIGPFRLLAHQEMPNMPDYPSRPPHSPLCALTRSMRCLGRPVWDIQPVHNRFIYSYHAVCSGLVGLLKAIKPPTKSF